MSRGTWKGTGGARGKPGGSLPTSRGAGGGGGAARDLQGPRMHSLPPHPDSSRGRSPPPRATAAPPSRPRGTAPSRRGPARHVRGTQWRVAAGPARRPHARRGGTGEERKAPRAWQLCPPRESCSRHPAGLAGACALLFLPPFPSSAGWVSALLLPWGGGGWEF